jgi:hypothetical protein
MKIFVCSLMFCCCAAVSAPAGDFAGTLWQRLIFCNQFAIEHPYPASFRDSTGFGGSMDRVGYRVHDCDLDTQHRDRDYRWPGKFDPLQKSMTTTMLKQC